MTRYAATLLLAATLALAHGEHGHGEHSDDPNLGYAERHVRLPLGNALTADGDGTPHRFL